MVWVRDEEKENGDSKSDNENERGMEKSERKTKKVMAEYD